MTRWNYQSATPPPLLLVCRSLSTKHGGQLAAINLLEASATISANVYRWVKILHWKL